MKILLSVLVVAMIGVMVPSAFASSHVDEILKSFEKESVIIGCKADGTSSIDIIGMFLAYSCYLLYLGNMRLKILNASKFEKLLSLSIIIGGS